uniref:Uncharacterized protein n=1 Tax=Octopus bimaculoides TaxID=37653 RepID=A0A0L8FXD4_OCTBM
MPDSLTGSDYGSVMSNRKSFQLLKQMFHHANQLISAMKCSSIHIHQYRQVVLNMYTLYYKRSFIKICNLGMKLLSQYLNIK